MANENQNQVATTRKFEVVYNVAGQEVKLTEKIVRDYLTKGNGTVSDQEIVMFTSVCKFNQLNPFLNEAYLVKFGQQPAQMIVSKEAYFKRADACPNYEGYEAGIIVQRGDAIIQLEGCFYEPKDILLGGWAKVYRSDRKFPAVATVRLEEYDKKQSIWNEKKSTMISKIAKVQALREAFPAQLGAMYTYEESQIKDAEYEEVKVEDEINNNANTDTIPAAPKQEIEAPKTEKQEQQTKIEEKKPQESKPKQETEADTLFKLK